MQDAPKSKQYNPIASKNKIRAEMLVEMLVEFSVF